MCDEAHGMESVRYASAHNFARTLSFDVLSITCAHMRTCAHRHGHDLATLVLVLLAGEASM